MTCIHKYGMGIDLDRRHAIALLVGAAAATGTAWAQFPQAPQPEPPKPEEEGPVISVESTLVNLFFSVREKKGGYIGNLTQNDFEVFEDGKKQTIRSFSRETDLPLTLGLLVDTSKSQETLIGVEQSASVTFFTKVLRQKDLAFLMQFGANCELLQDLTNSVAYLDRGLKQLRLDAGTGGGSWTPSTVPTSNGPRGTLLYDAVWLASRDVLKPQVGRKAMVIITDGNDQGSRASIEEAIEAAQRADSLIYGVMYEDARYTSAFYGGRSGEGPMKRLSEETGGRTLRVDRKHTLDQIYDEIQQEMRSQYNISYAPQNTAKDGTFRKLEIRTANKDYKVQVRRGYFAEKEG